MSRLEELRRIAASVGIAAHHTDALGEVHEPDAETLARLIAALGLPADPESATAALAAECGGRPFGLAPVHIVAHEASDPVLRLRVLEQAERPRLVCADTMNYWISSKRDRLLALLPRIDVLMVNDAEARQLAGEANVMKAAAGIEKMGARSVCIKRGEYGALLVSGNEAFFAPAFPLANVVDPTGAGDSFAGGFLGLLDRTGGSDLAALRQAVVMGCTIASFTVESFSLDRLRDLTLSEVRSRFESFRKLTEYEALHQSIA